MIGMIHFNDPFALEKMDMRNLSMVLGLDDVYDLTGGACGAFKTHRKQIQSSGLTTEVPKKFEQFRSGAKKG